MMEERNQTIQTRVNPMLLQALERICVLKNMTKAEYLREALLAKLDVEPDFYKTLAKQLKKAKII